MFPERRQEPTKARTSSGDRNDKSGDALYDKRPGTNPLLPDVEAQFVGVNEAVPGIAVIAPNISA